MFSYCTIVFNKNAVYKERMYKCITVQNSVLTNAITLKLCKLNYC